MTVDTARLNGVSSAPTSIRARLVRIAVLPLLVGAALLLAALTLIVILPPSYLSGALAGSAAVAAFAAVGRGMRLIRRACTTVERHLSTVRLFFRYPDVPGQRIGVFLEDLEQALTSRLFGVIALMPEDRTKAFVGSLRSAAQDSPVQLGAELDGQMSALSKDCRRWLDTLA
ncbi:hypothetical protein ACIPJN_29770 [Streptomyces sp. NPDC086796]|uniref:hypothetical protein n=1 Tax=Streptomyces sp. NPDC086796 TaxID=3365760 RepID=UPI0037FDE2F7